MRTPKPIPQPAFTLVELLVVMGVMVILMTLIAPAATSILKGTQVTATGQDIAANLALARQTALAQNRSVEVRFYKYIDLSISKDDIFRAYQLFGYDETNTVAKPLGKVQLLPPTIVLDTRSDYSSLFNSPYTYRSNWATGDLQVPLPRVGINYKAYTMRFRPDGSTNLPSTAVPAPFITVRSQTDLATPPKNFVTLQINPVSGSVKSYHP